MADIALSKRRVERQAIINAPDETVQGQSSFQVAQGLSDLSKGLERVMMRTQGLKAAEDEARTKAELSTWLQEQAASGNIENLGQRFVDETNKRIDNLANKNDNMFYRDAIGYGRVSILSSLAGQTEAAELSGMFLNEEKRIDSMLEAQNTFVLNNPGKWRTEADKAEAAINTAVLPADLKYRKTAQAKHDLAYTAASEALKIDPALVSRAMRSNEFEDSLSVSERQRFMAAAVTSGGTVKTNPALYANLSERAIDGENIMDEARDAMIGGHLTIENYNGLRTIVEKERTSNRSYMMKNLGSESFFKTLDQAEKESSAKREAEAWIRANPDASLFDVDQKIDELKYKYQLFMTNSSSVSFGEKQRQELIKRFYTPADNSSYKKPTIQGLRSSMQGVLMRNDLDDNDKRRVAEAIRVEILNLENMPESR